MNIRKALKNDIGELNILFTKVIEKMAENNIFMWNKIYPFCEFETDIENGNMFVLEEDNKIIGSFVISDKDDEDFNNINWVYNKEKWTSINRLAILPEEQGKGYAKNAIQYIERESKQNGYESIRLTVYERNLNAIRLYEKSGFKKVEEGYYCINKMKFIGYEKNYKKEGEI